MDVDLTPKQQEYFNDERIILEILRDALVCTQLTVVCILCTNTRHRELIKSVESLTSLILGFGDIT